MTKATNKTASKPASKGTLAKDAYERELARMKGMLNEASQEKSKLEKEVENLKQEHAVSERTQKGLENEVATLQEKINGLEKGLDDAREERIAAEDALKELTEKRDKQVEDFEAQIAALEERDGKATKLLNDNVRRAAEETRSLNSRIDMLESENKRLSAQSATFEGKASFYKTAAIGLGIVAVILVVILIL